MEVTYIGHSGFLVKMADCYLLFDYYNGTIPLLPADSRLYVFVSHSHHDHFNTEIFTLSEKYDVTYVLSYDIKLNAYGMKKYDVQAELLERIVSFRYDEDLQLADLRVRAFKSTDVGVAFLVNVEGCSIYHAGDHNWWHWMGESKQYNNNMAVNYKREILRLIEAEKKLDVAFVPLDPRLEESYYYGIKFFLDNVSCDVVFPMHFQEDYACRNRFVKEYGYGDRLVNIEYRGQCCEVKV